VTFDCVIRGGTVFDGRGAAPARADVAVSDGRIAACGDIGDADCREIDATGLFVAPGFIDIHSHSDYTLLVDPRAVSALHQGVTLEVIGNCGHGCFPIRDPALATKAIYGYSDAVDLSWRTAGEYFDRLAGAMPAVNVLSLVPNGQLRLSTLGLADRGATDDELQTMEGLLEESLAEGAWGLSTGLEYATESGATEAELAALCRPVAEAGGFYATHTRQRDAGSPAAVAEALRVAAAARVRLQLSHLIPRSGPEEGTECIALVERAHDRGLDVAFDMHTRRFGLTHLYAALPAAVLSGSKDTLTENLRDHAARERMKTHRSILSAGGDWSRVMLLDNPIWPQYARTDLATIAADRGAEPHDAVFDLLLDAVDDLHGLMVAIDCYSEGQQREAFQHRLCMPAADATTLTPDVPLAASQFHGAYTWAAWFYRFMVREQQLLEPAEAVHRLTGLPAERLGLRDRGVLESGARADIVVFDPEQYGECGTMFEPNRPAKGVEHLLVNGVLSLGGGELTRERAGEVLRRS
jgi:N-acyl-D-aspartate/D-glutamate deacylase